MFAQRSDPSIEGRRIVICDYNALLLSVIRIRRQMAWSVPRMTGLWLAASQSLKCGRNSKYSEFSAGRRPCHRR